MNETRNTWSILLWPILLWSILLVAACAVAVTAQQEASSAGTPETGTPDRDLSLDRGSVFDVATPDPILDRTTDPGDNELLPRAFDKAPPLVPHGVADLLPITRDSNLCVDCHMIEEAGEGEPTPIPASHYTDLRRSPDKVGDKLAGARYLCVSCHVAPGSSTPLPVGNTFGGASP